MKGFLKSLSVIIAALILLESAGLTAFAKGKRQYRSMTVLGDSVSLGYLGGQSARGDDYLYDIEQVSYISAGKYIRNWEGEAEPYDPGLAESYPVVLADMLGIDRFLENNAKQHIFLDGDAYDDVYNCSALGIYSGDYLSILRGEEPETQSLLSTVLGREYNYSVDYINDKVENSDLVIVAVGGNDLFQGLVSKMVLDTGTDYSIYEKAVVLFYSLFALTGDVLDTISLVMQVVARMDPESAGVFDGIMEKLSEDPLSGAAKDLGPVFDILSDIIAGLLASPTDTSAIESITDQLSGTDVEDVMSSPKVQAALASATDAAHKFAEFMVQCIENSDPENMRSLMDDVITGLGENVSEILEEIRRKNPSARIVVVGQFNPFDPAMTIDGLAELLESGNPIEAFMQKYGITRQMASEVYEVAKRIASELIDYKNSTDSDVGMLETKIMVILMTIIMTSEEDYDYTSNSLANDFLYGIMSVMAGRGVERVVGDMNGELENAVRKFNRKYNGDALFADISGLPATGRADPHPTDEGHEYIAQVIYDLLTEDEEAERSADPVEIRIPAAGTSEEEVNPDTGAPVFLPLAVLIAAAACAFRKH